MAIAGRYVKDLDENDLAAIQAAAEKSAAEAPPLSPRAARVIRNALEREALSHGGPAPAA
jgi:hypothetical protein